MRRIKILFCVSHPDAVVDNCYECIIIYSFDCDGIVFLIFEKEQEKRIDNASYNIIYYIFKKNEPCSD